MASVPLLPALKKHFGFSSFRPLQEEIIRDALAGRDVFALLPTGGGKSLCFQLPALLRPGLTLVVSPLIALMKDQVDALLAGGVAATLLNSSIDAAESRARFRDLHNGKFRLLYVAPERLMLSGFLEHAKKWDVNLIAIDEAHCISEWGHDFRPEYRQLSQLRDHFPGTPLMALTATATERVRLDILRQLGLSDAACYTASFNRPNLTYAVAAKSKPYEQARKFIRAHSKESGIVYCQSRKTAESVAQRLSADGVLARPYHAGLEPAERAANQDAFLCDKARVMCGTIAFGMGINKPNVRYIIHYDLPKNVEGYYQETGRAGRDGLPGECLLLFSAGDVVKQTRFIQEKSDPREQALAREQLQSVVHYAESGACRRATLLGYFGEKLEVECTGCDNCLSPKETFDGTLAAQKLMSCVYRVREKSGFSFGLNHMIEVLTGGATDAIRKWRHEETSVYGIGKEMTKPQWQAIGRELIRLGFLAQSTGQFAVVELTPEGAVALKQRKQIQLTKPAQAAPAPGKKSRAAASRGEIECDEVLFDRLRVLRRRIADERAVPAYVIFSDVSLRVMARDLPRTPDAFGHVSGVGEQKRKEFAEIFIKEIQAHAAAEPKSPTPSEKPYDLETMIEEF